MIRKRILAGVIGLGLGAAVVYVGLQSSGNTGAIVVWFGLAAAFLAPLGLSLLGYAVIGSDRSVIRRLANVPEIQQLVNRAHTEQERLDALQRLRDNLDRFIEFEAHRRSLEDRRAAAEGTAIQSLRELKNIERQASELHLELPEGQNAQEVRELQERLAAELRGDVVLNFAGRAVVVRGRILDHLPFYSGFFRAGLEELARLQKRRIARQLAAEPPPAEARPENPGAPPAAPN